MTVLANVGYTLILDCCNDFYCHLNLVYEWGSFISPYYNTGRSFLMFNNIMIPGVIAFSFHFIFFFFCNFVLCPIVDIFPRLFFCLPLCVCGLINPRLVHGSVLCLMSRARLYPENRLLLPHGV